MPLPITLANLLVSELRNARINKRLLYLRPDGKSQITLQYDSSGNPEKIHTIVLSAQHDETVEPLRVEKELKELIFNSIEKKIIDNSTRIFINPTGRFVIGGPMADTGLTGRKIMVDTYGGIIPHGGGAFSGKDPSKVDRSGAYAARWVAKNIVATQLAEKCQVKLSYIIGYQDPIQISIDTFGTSLVNEMELEKAVKEIFDLTPKGIISSLDLYRPIYKQTAFGGHFGKEELPWEKLDKVEALKSYF